MDTRAGDAPAGSPSDLEPRKPLSVARRGRPPRRTAASRHAASRNHRERHAPSARARPRPERPPLPIARTRARARQGRVGGTHPRRGDHGDGAWSGARLVANTRLFLARTRARARQRPGRGSPPPSRSSSRWGRSGAHQRLTFHAALGAYRVRRHAPRRRRCCAWARWDGASIDRRTSPVRASRHGAALPDGEARIAR